MAAKNPKTKAASKAKNIETKNARALVAIVFAVAILAGFLVVLPFGLYFLNWHNFVVRKIVTIIPYPAAVVTDASLISYADYQQRIEILRRYHELRGLTSRFKNYDLSQEEGIKYFQIAKKNLLNQLIRIQFIENSAQEFNLKITPADIEEEFAEIAQNSGGEAELILKIQRVYGLEPGQFKALVLADELLERKLYHYLLGQGEINAQDDTDFSRWLFEHNTSLRVFVPLRQYYWDQGAHTLRFRDQGLNEYETTVIQDNLEILEPESV